MSSNLEADAGLSCTSERCEVESCSGGHVYRWRGVHKSLRTSLSFSTGKSHLFLLVDVTPPTRLRKLVVHCHHPSAGVPTALHAACLDRAHHTQTGSSSHLILLIPERHAHFLDPTNSGNTAASQTSVLCFVVIGNAIKPFIALSPLVWNKQQGSASGLWETQVKLSCDLITSLS